MLFRRLCLAAFVVYTLALLTATHWPGLQIQGPVNRSDLYIHFMVFSAWAVLLGFSGLVGRSPSRLLVIGLAFAILDETTQPLFRRQFDWADLAANAGGILMGTLGMAALWRVLGASEPADGGGAGA
jgi:VanZ family protein